MPVCRERPAKTSRPIIRTWGRVGRRTLRNVARRGPKVVSPWSAGVGTSITPFFWCIWGEERIYPCRSQMAKVEQRVHSRRFASRSCIDPFHGEQRGGVRQIRLWSFARRLRVVAQGPGYSPEPSFSFQILPAKQEFLRWACLDSNQGPLPYQGDYPMFALCRHVRKARLDKPFSCPSEK